MVAMRAKRWRSYTVEIFSMFVRKSLHSLGSHADLRVCCVRFVEDVEYVDDVQHVAERHQRRRWPGEVTGAGFDGRADAGEGSGRRHEGFDHDRLQTHRVRGAPRPQGWQGLAHKALRRGPLPQAGRQLI